jgi:hypothetical protein
MINAAEALEKQTWEIKMWEGVKQMMGMAMLFIVAFPFSPLPNVNKPKTLVTGRVTTLSLSSLPMFL